MVRLVLLVERPPHLAPDKAEAWLRCELGALARRPEVGRVSVSRLESVSLRFSRGSDWLIEMECAAEGDAIRTTCQSAFRELFGDLRLIGMQPVLALANSPIQITGDAAG